ncbi:MAG: hypothetical protein ACRC2R_01480 [Xenococcaceae cyanobacterium]
MMYLQIFLSVTLVAIALYTGYTSIPLWIIAILGVSFTISYIQGKWYAWEELLADRNAKFYSSIAIAYLIQCIVVSIFYLIGAGISKAIG